MADDGGGLLVQIGVTQARMERELAKLVKSASKSADDMENSFTAANQNIGKNAATAFAGASRGANQATGAIKNTSFATANLAAQLNDIGVSLAGGQSPFTVMLQQGTQISQIFTQTGGTIRSFGSLLAGAVTSVLNPFSLLTFAIIGAGGYAVQYFMDLVSGGEKSNKAIKEQADLIQSVAKQWGDALPALQAYVDALASSKDAADLLKVSEGLASDQWAVARKEIDLLNVSYADLMSMISDGADPEIIGRLSSAFSDLREKIHAGTATQEDFNAVQDALAAAVSATGIPAIGDFASAFAGLSQTIAGATAQAARFRKEALQALALGKDRPLGQLSPLFSEGGKFMSGDDFTPRGNAPTPESRPLIELEGLPGQYKSDGSLAGRKTGGGGGGRGANAYKSEVEGIRERTAALRESTAAQAAVNPLVSDYGYALEKAKAEQKLLADAQRSGMAITPALREQISALAGEYAQASADAKKLSESQADVKKQAEAFAAMEKDVFGGFIKDLKDGKSGAEALSNALQKVADRLMDMALDGLFSIKGGTGGGGSGFFGAILGGLGKVLGFSKGTANTGGRRGEPRGIVHGNEAVIPLPAGGKVPVTLNSPKASDMQRAPSRDVVQLRLADDSGRMAEIADQRIRTASGTIVQISVDQSYKTVKSNMPGLITDAQARAG